MSRLLLGLRADPTHTEATLTTSEGKVWGYVRLPNACASSSRELLERAFQESCIELPGPIPPLVAVMALPGLRSEALRRSAAETVRSILPQGSHSLICDELEPLIALHFRGSPGVLLWSDLEAAVGHLDEEHVFTRYCEDHDPLGQEGSGLWLGTRTLQLTARLLEGRLPDSQRLSQILTEHFAQSSVREVWEQVMSEPPDAVSLMELAQRTIALARHPEPEPSCRALVVRAGRRLGDLLAQVPDTTKESLGASWGGRSATGSLLQEVQEQNPRFRWLAAPPEGALEGCLLLCRAVIAEDISPEAREPSSVEDTSPKHWQALRALSPGGSRHG